MLDRRVLDDRLARFQRRREVLLEDLPARTLGSVVGGLLTWALDNERLPVGALSAAIGSVVTLLSSRCRRHAAEEGAVGSAGSDSETRAGEGTSAWELHVRGLRSGRGALA